MVLFLKLKYKQGYISFWLLYTEIYFHFGFSIHTPVHLGNALAIKHHALQKHLGYFYHNFRLSHLHECDQGMLSNRFT